MKSAAIPHPDEIYGDRGESTPVQHEQISSRNIFSASLPLPGARRFYRRSGLTKKKRKHTVLMAAAALSMASPKKDVIFYFLQASLEKVQHILYLHDNLKETLLHLNANVNL